eukprot:6137385-Pyramimonas_sp.AAC.1
MITSTRLGVGSGWAGGGARIVKSSMSHRTPKGTLKQAVEQSRNAGPLPNGKGSFVSASTARQ